MIAIELLENHPLASKVVSEWFLKEMRKSFKDPEVPEEMKQAMEARGVSNEHLATFLDINPRMLFDVLDASNYTLAFIERTFCSILQSMEKNVEKVMSSVKPQSG